MSFHLPIPLSMLSGISGDEPIPLQCRSPSSNHASSINPRDDVKAGFRMMRKGTPDAKKFEKYFPHTTRDLRAGKMSQPQLILDLISMYVRLNEESGGMYLDSLTCMELAKDSAYCALPKRLQQRAWRADDGEAAWTDFSRSMFHSLLEKMKRIDPDNGATIPVLLKESVDEVCKERADDLDASLFRGKRGQFLKKCPIYDKPARSYYDNAMPLWSYTGKGTGTCFVIKDPTNSGGYGARHDELTRLVRHVATNLIANRRICWECETCPEDGLKECAKCHLASYCSVACQRKAWKEGHRSKCDATRSTFDVFNSLIRKDGDEESSFETELQEVHGVSLSRNWEHHLAYEMLFKKNPLWQGTTLEHRIGLPSVKFFYKNLCKVARGEWWLYENATDSAYLEANLSQSAEVKYAECLCMVLCHDFEGIELSDFDEGTWVVSMQKYYGVAMPAAKFVHLYKMLTWGMSTVGTNKDQKSGIVEELRKSFHK